MPVVLLRQIHYKWGNIGDISVAGTLLTTDKSAATTHSLTPTTIVKIQPANGTVALDIRWRGGSNDDSNVHVLYAMRGSNDHYTRILTLTLTTGTQTDGTRLFIDKIEKADEKWPDEIQVMSDEANGIAHITLNCHSYSHFLLLGTTVNSTLYVDVSKE